MGTRVTGRQILDDSITGDDVNESSLSISELKDADADTKIEVEKSPDEDKIRFSTAGTERLLIETDGGIGFGTGSVPGAAGSWSYYTFKGGGVRVQGNNFYCDNNRGLFWGDSSVQIKGDAASETLDLKANYTTYIRLEGTSGNIGIGTGTPTAPVHLGGNMKIDGGVKVSITDISSNYSATESDYLLRCNPISTIDIALPARGTSAGMKLIIKDATGNAGTNRIRINPSSPDTIDGAASFDLNVNHASITIICDGINGWMITG